MKKHSDIENKAIDLTGTENEMSIKADITFNENDSVSVFSQAKANWYFGEWELLAELDLESLKNDEHLASLVLLKASAYQQLGQSELCESLLRVARKLGTDNKTIAKILIAGVHNTLAKVSALQKNREKMQRHFQEAVHIGDSKTVNRNATQARSIKELSDLGLFSDALVLLETSMSKSTSLKHRPSEIETELVGLSSQLRVLKRQVNAVEGNKKKKSTVLNKVKENTDYLSNPIFSDASLKFFQSRKDLTLKDSPFIQIDSKSLPRSGLHYMKNTFSELLGKHFSFCEWYQEPGCCKKMPCAHTGFAVRSQNEKLASIRLIKSHDFELSDPIFPTGGELRRVVLHRDPLFILTSYFALDQLSQYKQELHDSNINLEKIWLSHEKPILTEAYNIMDKDFKPFPLAELQNWLEYKVKYISGFLNKWTSDESVGEQVNYEDINTYIISVIEEIQNYLPSDIQTRVEKFKSSKSKGFSARANPFVVQSKRMSEYLVSNSQLFNDAAKAVVERSRQ